MSKKFSSEYIETAHKATLHNETAIMQSTVCTCFYCGFQFNANQAKDLEWWDETNPKGKTIVCPMCGIDVVVGDASGFPVTDNEFIIACTEAWFGGMSRISDGKPVKKVEYQLIEVD